jgi:hypothetical protein
MRVTECGRLSNAALMCSIWSYFRPYLGIQTLRGQVNRAAAD